MLRIISQQYAKSSIRKNIIHQKQFALRNSSSTSHADYLRTWLGNDVSGDSYLHQLVKKSRETNNETLQAVSAHTNNKDNKVVDKIESEFDSFQTENIQIANRSFSILTFSTKSNKNNANIADIQSLIDTIRTDMDAYVTKLHKANANTSHYNNIIIDFEFLNHFVDKNSKRPENAELIDNITQIHEIFDVSIYRIDVKFFFLLFVYVCSYILICVGIWI